jgi:hypothetical protein
LFLIKGERKRERKKKRVNCGVLVSLQRQKFYFSEEEKVKKLLSLLFSLLAYFAFRRLAHSPAASRFKRTKKRKKGITNNIKRTNEVFYPNALFRT